MGPLSEILTIASLRHAASRVWTCAEPEFRLSWISCAVVITTTPRRHKFIDRFIELTLLEYAHLCSMWSSSKYNLKLFLYAAIIIQLNSGKRESLRFLKFLLQINVNEWYSLVSARVMKLLLPSNFQGTESLSETCLNEVTFTNIKYTKQTLRWKFT